MNEGLLVEMLGDVNPTLLEEEYLEYDLKTNPSNTMEDFEKQDKLNTHQNTLKVIATITAGSLLATGTILLAVKFRKGNLVLPIMKK